MVTKREREQRLTTIRRLQREIAADGMRIPADLPHLAALTASLASILGDRRDPTRASRAALYCYEAADKTIRGLAVEGLACKKGCSYCCRACYVSASPPQVFAAANYVRQHTPNLVERLQRIREIGHTTRNQELNQRLDARQPCALLEHDTCTVYPARPVACRTFSSFSLIACEESFASNTDNIPVPEDYMKLRPAIEQPLWAAMWEHGLPEHCYEFNHAMLVALEHEDSETRWLSGEDIFAEVEKDTSGKPMDDQVHLIFQVLLAVSKGEDPPPNPWM